MLLIRNINGELSLHKFEGVLRWLSGASLPVITNQTTSSELHETQRLSCLANDADDDDFARVVRLPKTVAHPSTALQPCLLRLLANISVSHFMVRSSWLVFELQFFSVCFFFGARFLNPRSKVAPRIDSWLRFAVSFRGLTRVADWKRLHSRGSKLEVWPIAVCCLAELLAASCRLPTSPTHCKAEGRGGGGLALLYGCRFVTVSCFDFAIMKLLLLVRCALVERVWTNQSEKLTSKIIQIVYGNYCGASIISVLTIGQWSQGDCFGCCYCCCCCCSVVVFSPVWETTAAAAS